MNKQLNSSIIYNLPFCPTHSNQILNALELRTDDAKLICLSCLLNIIQTQKNYDASKIVDLLQVYDHPENTFQFIAAKEKTTLGQFLNYQIEQMNKINQQIEQLLKELQQWHSELMQQQKTILLNIIKQDEFKQNFEQLANQDKNIKNETILEIQNKFYNYFQSIKVINQEATQKDMENLDKLYKDMTQKVGKCEEIYKSLNQILLKQIGSKKVLDQPIIQPIITIQNNVNRQVKDKKGIYKSQEDGLTFDAIRKAIIGKDNLLWFFKSSNNGCTEFGAFTPYIWKEGYSGTNNSNPSFLFSKTLNQIYPIIQSKGTCTQYFSSGYILFGGTQNYDQDLRVNPDFKSGYSRLGVGYQAPEGVDTSKYSTHLFGALEPNVIECEIYQIIFE